MAVSLPGVAQDLEQAALRELSRGRLDSAARLFADLLTSQPNSDRRDTWLYNRGRCRFHLGELVSARGDFSALLRHYPTSSLRSYTQYFLGNIAVQNDSPLESLAPYARAYTDSEDPNLIRLLEISLGALLSAYPQAGDSLLSVWSYDPAGEQMLEKLIVSVAHLSAESYSAGLSHELATNSGRKKSTIRSSRSGKVLQVALALPFSGRFESYANQIQRGAQLALNQATDGPEIELTLHDTEGDPVKAAMIVREVQESKTLAIIGPLTSEEAVAVSAALACAEIPVLAPMASQANFTQLSETMYQLTPSPEMIGRRLAEYAFLEIPVASAAALAPNTDKERRMAEAFAERFRALGGEIMALEIFPPRATDFGGFCRKIKDRYLAPYLENATLIDADGDTLDLDEAPVQIGCIFVSATHAQLQLILPQINFHNIGAIMIGSDGLASPRIWDMKLQNIKQIIFSSWQTQDPNNLDYRAMAERYRKAFGESPNRLVTMGYDAMRLIIAGARSGANKPDKLARYFSQLQEFSGASGQVQFGADHINQALALYTVVDLTAKRINWVGPVHHEEKR